ncbi:ABC transporter ATP-binding protein [Mesorhizobium sp. CO1-1-8]|uniref:ABC transporter ATP-binding protein n=1 Tax=Mesorhizobium sp. CO1-1-8 TaxID=2876631 RepID=UPI001CD06E1C|nr:ABC transporter ATP-binding protein [Mesorhizobium sp. CO1-1-8]MBZ9772514.1 ABC transporter ATP-binding protein [Mesorhizobium sp. CO1-1-8]
MTRPHIHFDNVSKSYGPLQVVSDLSLAIEAGEFVSLLGPSGSGKTTLLMMLAGFEQVTSGSIWLGQRRIDALPPHRRDMGVVFQNYALFPHMNVAQNVAFPLRMRHLGQAEIKERVLRALDMVQLTSLRDRRPGQLSGGQQQRVALARALVFEPAVVLMDEPLGALDKQLRQQMQLDIRALHHRLGLTIVFVTHDQIEALTMSDRIAVFNRGGIEQIGTPREVYDRPATRFVAEFIGETNLIEGIVEQLKPASSLIRLDDGKTLEVAGDAPVGRRVLVSVRPERVSLAEGTVEGANAWPATVVDSIYQGDHLRVQLDASANGFVVRSGRGAGEWAPNTAAIASFAPSDCWVVPQ